VRACAELWRGMAGRAAIIASLSECGMAAAPGACRVASSEFISDR